MNLIRISVLGLLIALIVGCSTKPTVIYKTEYKEVKVPVVYKIERPDRPIFKSTDTTHIYLLKVLEYTQTLELIIDEHNQGL